MDLITTHLNADFDGLASMVAARKLYPDAVLTLSAGAQESVRRYLAAHDLGLVPLRDLALDGVTRLIVVDAQEPERLGTLGPLCRKPGVALHLFDHHVGPEMEPTSERTAVRAEVRVVEPVGATVTILIERLHAEGVALTPFEATVLAIGLYEETGSLRYPSTTPRDLEAAADLVRAGADLNQVTEALQSHLVPEEIAVLDDLLTHAEPFYLDARKVLLATGRADRYQGELAGVVQKMTELERVDAVIAAVAMEEKVEIIGRSRHPDIDVAALLAEFGGGGHAEAAAASVKGRTLVEVRERLVEALTRRHKPTLLARDVMTVPVKSIGEETAILAAERAMTTYGVNVLPILDGKGRYAGLMTRESVQKALFHGFRDEPVQAFLHTDWYGAEPDTPFREIQAQMIERNQRFVPVLDGSRIVGVITRTDLLRALHEDVLAAAGARAKRPDAGALPAHRRHLASLLRERVPARPLALLEDIGRLADEQDVSAYVVGGFVRDLLLGVANLDLDVVVEGDGIAFARALAQRGGATVKAHERFGTAHLRYPDGTALDVATARTEYYEYPTALPTVERSSIKKDLYRRDFTINALAIRLNGRAFGELVDFYGGQRDLKEGTIRVLHSLSFVEDPTRVFRAVRFAHRLGFTLGRETQALIKGAAKMELFHRLSGRRLLEELKALFAESDVPAVVAKLAESDVLRFVHPALQRTGVGPPMPALLKRAEEAVEWHGIAALTWPPAKPAAAPLDRWLVYFMALMEGVPPSALSELLTRLAMPERHAAKIKSARYDGSKLLRRLVQRPPLKPSQVVRILDGQGEETLVFLMAKAASATAKREIAAYLSAYRFVKPSLTGADLQRLGLKPGPRHRQVLDALRAARLDGRAASEADERRLAERCIST